MGPVQLLQRKGQAPDGQAPHTGQISDFAGFCCPRLTLMLPLNVTTMAAPWESTWSMGSVLAASATCQLTSRSGTRKVTTKHAVQRISSWLRMLPIPNPMKLRRPLGPKPWQRKRMAGSFVTGVIAARTARKWKGRSVLAFSRYVFASCGAMRKISSRARGHDFSNRFDGKLRLETGARVLFAPP